MRTSVLKQVNVGQWLGNAKQVISSGGVYFNLLNLIQTSLILYQTKWVQQNVISLSFWQFIGLLVGFIVCFFLLIWKLDLPSTFSAYNRQVWEHNNPLRQELEQIKAELVELNKKLEGVEQKTGGEKML